MPGHYGKKPVKKSVRTSMKGKKGKGRKCK